MPDFYLNMSTVNHTCPPLIDELAKKYLSSFGVCNSINDYDLRKDDQGFPLIEDCQKNNFMNYYLTTESMSVFE